MIPVGAANIQGFEWNYENGSSMLFLTSYRMDGKYLHGPFYMILSSLYPELPYSISSWDDIPTPKIEGSHEGSQNGVINPYEHTIFTYLHHTGGRFAVPIGNFNALTKIANASIANVSFIDNSNYWGMEAFISRDEDSLRIVTKYAKSDGFLAQHFIYLTNDTGDEEAAHICRKGFATDQLTQDLGYCFGLSGLLVCIALMKYKMKYKNKNR